MEFSTSSTLEGESSPTTVQYLYSLDSGALATARVANHIVNLIAREEAYLALSAPVSS